MLSVSSYLHNYLGWQCRIHPFWNEAHAECLNKTNTENYHFYFCNSIFFIFKFSLFDLVSSLLPWMHNGDPSAVGPSRYINIAGIPSSEKIQRVNRKMDWKKSGARVAEKNA